MVRTSFALFLSSGATLALGFAFWVLAARLFPATEVGLAVAAISAVELITAVASLGWRSTLLRFVGGAGPGTRRLVKVAYLTAGSCAVVGGVVFLLGQPWWTPEMAALRSGLLPVAFVAVCFGWMVFQLQDSVLLGAGMAAWVPVENASFSALRVLFLVPFAAADSALGVFYAWSLALVPLVIAVNVILARRLPRANDQSAGPSFRPLVRFALADWVSKGAGLATSAVLPLIVLSAEGPEAAGIYYMAWMLVNAVRLVSANVADALVVHAGQDEATIPANASRAGRLALAISLPMVAALIFGAPVLLGVFGQDYARGGTTLLRLMAVSSVPYVVVKMSSGLARARQQNRRLVAITGSTALLVVGLTPVLMAGMGLNGVGLAWLVGLSVVAARCVTTDPVAWWRAEPAVDPRDVDLTDPQPVGV